MYISRIDGKLNSDVLIQRVGNKGINRVIVTSCKEWVAPTSRKEQHIIQLEDHIEITTNTIFKIEYTIIVFNYIIIYKYKIVPCGTI